MKCHMPLQMQFDVCGLNVIMHMTLYNDGNNHRYLISIRVQATNVNIYQLMLMDVELEMKQANQIMIEIRDRFEIGCVVFVFCFRNYNFSIPKFLDYNWTVAFGFIFVSCCYLCLSKNTMCITLVKTSKHVLNSLN